jgi:deoxyribodipyrimidine photo-lyase
MSLPEVSLFWFRRDLRLEDNAALFYALKENKNVLPVFIFDKTILELLSADDRRIQFIYDALAKIKIELQALGSDFMVVHDTPIQFYKKILKQYKVKNVYTNHDYEPKAIERDVEIQKMCEQQNVEFKTYKDHVIFEKNEIQSDSYKSYTVYTPYKKKWLASLSPFYIKPYPNKKYFQNLYKFSAESIPTLNQLGFTSTDSNYPPLKLSKSILKGYKDQRDIPSLDATSKLGLHLRFGTVSIRYLASIARLNSEVWLSELIWRDFFIQALWTNPASENLCFKPDYEKIEWSYDKDDFERWKNGQTGYPMVDAGMRELNATGHMHNRVRMVTASFLTKHLLQHWKKGERYFAEKLYDYDLAANVGNWQWAAGTGCDAAPYFRIFNPTSQQERFDPDFKYIKKWIPEYGTPAYVKPMVEHVFARERCLKEYKKGLAK